MPKFVVYEIWTRSRVVEGQTVGGALDENFPAPVPGLELSNWHAVPLDDQRLDDGRVAVVAIDGVNVNDIDEPQRNTTGALNYRQVK